MLLVEPESKGAVSDTMERRMFHRPTSHLRPVPTASEVSEARFKRFIKDMESYERKLTFQSTLDAFLDLYSTWKRTRHQPLKLRLVMLAFELHRLDRDFRCDLSFPEQTPCEKSSSET